MRDWRTSLLGVSLLVAAAAFVSLTRILDTSEGKAIVSAMTLSGVGFLAARDAGK